MNTTPTPTEASISAAHLTTLANALHWAATDPAFMVGLRRFVEQQERVVEENARRKVAVEKIIEEPDSRETRRLAILESANGRLHFSGREWVPDEYETLERLRLVSCEFGCADRSGLPARIIHLTREGQAVLSAIAAAKEAASA